MKLTWQSELWELTQAFLDVRRRGVFYQNRAFCFHYRRFCAYFPLCRADGSTNVIENFYRKVPPRTKSCGTRPRSKRLRLFEDPIEKENRHVAYEEKSPQAGSRRETEKRSVDLLDEKQIKPIVDMVTAGIMGIETAQEMLGLDPAKNPAGSRAEASWAGPFARANIAAAVLIYPTRISRNR